MLNTPDIRFKGFTKPWEQSKLGEIAELTSSKRIHAEDYVDNGVPFYRGKEISELREHEPVSEILYITEEKYIEITKLYGSPSKGDLLITAVGTLGNTWVVDKLPFYFKDGNLIWFKNIKCDSKFLDYMLSTPEGQKNIDSSAIGSNQKALTIVKLKELDFMFTDITEQQQIAQYFDNLDNLITLHQRKCDGMSELKKFMLQKMFPRNGEQFPEIRFSGFTDPWEQRQLGDITERITRKNQDLESELPLTISAQYGLIDQNEFFDKRIASKDVSGYYLVKKGEFAYNKSTSLDAPWGTVKRLERYEKGVLSTLYIVFGILDTDKTNSDYLVTYYDTDLWHRGVQAIAAEGARNHGLLNITPSDFFETTLSIPQDIEEQKLIGKYFRQLDALITLHHRKCDELKEFKKFMLQNMFPKKG